MMSRRLIKLLLCFVLAAPISATVAATFPLTVAVYSDTLAELLWYQPDIVNQDTAYIVYRDGMPLSELSQKNRTMSYMDDTVLAGVRHQYRVAVVKNGEEIASTLVVSNQGNYIPSPMSLPALVPQTIFPSAPCLLELSGRAICQPFYRSIVLGATELKGYTASDPGPYQHIDGDRHGTVCGIKLDGTIACWSPDSANPMLSYPVSDLPFTQLSVGSVHACAIDAAGKLHCWGDDRHGQLQVLERLGPFTTVSVGDYYSGAHTCAINDVNELHCWGANQFGQSQVFPFTGPYVAVAAGGAHTCGVQSSGGVICRGNNQDGQLDIPDSAMSVQAIDASGALTCALDSDGRPVCWGGSAESDRQAWQAPGDPSGFVSIDVGEFVCATREDDTQLCWNEDGSVAQFDPYPAPPQQLRYTQYSVSMIELFWERPQGFWSDILSYEVYRDGEFHMFTYGRSILDDDLRLNELHTYDIYTIDASGLRSSIALSIDLSSRQGPYPIDVASGSPG